MRPFFWLFICLVVACSAPSNPQPPNPTVPPSSTVPPGLTTPPSTTINRPVTPPLQIPAGYESNIKAVADGRWDSSVTWGGRLPAANDIVEIPRGRSVDLGSTTPSLRGVWLDGTLNFVGDLHLTTNFLFVSGKLQAGSETAPYSQNARITLTGNNESETILGMGNKLLGVLNGGLLKLHGQQRLAWTKLSANAPVGSSSLSLSDDASTWRVGDKLMLVSSSFDPREAEVLTITSVSGKQIGISPALQHARVAMQQTYGGKTLDQRPAIGLLSRNIVIEGAADADASQFGGHVMVMDGGNAQISGIELRKMGQLGIKGRYPMHWHQANDRAGNYLVSSSIHDSFQRAAVLHSSNQVLLDGNVAYNIVNHAFVWAEDGNEKQNTLSRNLVSGVTSPEESGFSFPINNAFFGNTSQGEHRSAAFWGRSLEQHTITGNISAGVLDGFGFFVDLFTPAPFAGDDSGKTSVFAGNTVHSTLLEMAIGNQVNYPEATRGQGLMVTTGTSAKTQHIFESLTAYHNTSGVWLEDRTTTLKNSMVADNGLGVQILRGVIDDVVFVGDSANPVPLRKTAASLTFADTAAINVGGSNHGGKRSPVIQKATIVDQPGYGMIWDVDNVSPESLLQNIEFINTPKRFVMLDPLRFEFPYSPAFGLTDSAGQLEGDGKPVRVLPYDSPITDASCTQREKMQAFLCPREKSLLLRSSQDLTLVEQDGQVYFAQNMDYYDNALPNTGSVSFLANNGRYEVLGVEGSNLELRLEDGSGKKLELAFAATSAGSATLNNQSLGAASSLAALRSSGSGTFFDATTKRFYVQVVSSAAYATLIVNASFDPNSTSQFGLATKTFGGGVAGFVSSTSSSATQKVRYATPTQAASRSATYNNATMDGSGFITHNQKGETTVLRGFIFAPTDGIYRIGLWGDGGGTAIYLDDTWVMGQPWAYINSNFVKNGQLETEVVPYLHPSGLVSLKSGWHEIKVVFSKFPEHTSLPSQNFLALRWATPSNPQTWVYPEVRREP